MPSPAAAQNQPTLFVSPFFGSAAATDTAVRSGAPTVGVGVGWRASRRWGVEVELGGRARVLQGRRIPDE